MSCPVRLAYRDGQPESLFEPSSLLEGLQDFPRWNSQYDLVQDWMLDDSNSSSNNIDSNKVGYAWSVAFWASFMTLIWMVWGMGLCCCARRGRERMDWWSGRFRKCPRPPLAPPLLSHPLPPATESLLMMDSQYEHSQSYDGNSSSESTYKQGNTTTQYLLGEGEYDYGNDDDITQEEEEEDGVVPRRMSDPDEDSSSSEDEVVILGQSTISSLDDIISSLDNISGLSSPTTEVGSSSTGRKAMQPHPTTSLLMPPETPHSKGLEDDGESDDDIYNDDDEDDEKVESEVDTNSKNIEAVKTPNSKFSEYWKYLEEVGGSGSKPNTDSENDSDSGNGHEEEKDKEGSHDDANPSLDDDPSYLNFNYMSQTPHQNPKNLKRQQHSTVSMDSTDRLLDEVLGDGESDSVALSAVLSTTFDSELPPPPTPLSLPVTTPTPSDQGDNDDAISLHDESPTILRALPKDLNTSFPEDVASGFLFQSEGDTDSDKATTIKAKLEPRKCEPKASTTVHLYSVTRETDTNPNQTSSTSPSKDASLHINDSSSPSSNTSLPKSLFQSEAASRKRILEQFVEERRQRALQTTADKGPEMPSVLVTDDSQLLTDEELGIVIHLDAEEYQQLREQEKLEALPEVSGVTNDSATPVKEATHDDTSKQWTTKSDTVSTLTPPPSTITPRTSSSSSSSSSRHVVAPQLLAELQLGPSDDTDDLLNDTVPDEVVPVSTSDDTSNPREPIRPEPDLASPHPPSSASKARNLDTDNNSNDDIGGSGDDMSTASPVSMKQLQTPQLRPQVDKILEMILMQGTTDSEESTQKEATDFSDNDDEEEEKQEIDDGNDANKSLFGLWSPRETIQRPTKGTESTEPNSDFDPTSSDDHSGDDQQRKVRDIPGEFNQAFKEYQKRHAEWTVARRAYSKRLNRLQTATIAFCTLLVVASLLGSTNGIWGLEWQRQQILETWDTVKTQLESLSGIVSEQRNLETNVQQQIQSVWRLLDQHCPLVRENTCPLAHNYEGIFLSSSPSSPDFSPAATTTINTTINSTILIPESSVVCNVSGLPLEGAWEQWLDTFVDIPTTEARLISTQNSNTAESWDSVLVDINSLLEDDPIGRSFGGWDWALWASVACNATLSVWALLILAAVSLQGAIRLHNYLCTWSFTITYWGTVLLTWAFGICFYIGTTLAVDACTTPIMDGSSTSPAMVTKILLDRLPSESYLPAYWDYIVNGCPESAYPEFLNQLVWSWGSYLPAMDRMTTELESISSTEFLETCGFSSATLQNAMGSLNSQICMATQSIVNIRRSLGCDQWYPWYDAMINDSICDNSSPAFVWSSVCQTVVIFLAFLIWTSRASFMSMRIEFEDEVPEEDVRKVVVDPEQGQDTFNDDGSNKEDKDDDSSSDGGHELV